MRKSRLHSGALSMLHDFLFIIIFNLDPQKSVSMEKWICTFV